MEVKQRELLYRLMIRFVYLPRYLISYLPCDCYRFCRLISGVRSPYLPTRTDKSRQEPTRAAKCRHETFLCIFRLKYYLLDHIYALYIQISHMVAFATPKNDGFTTLQIALLTDKKFCEAVLAVYVGCHRDFIVIPKTA